MATRSGKKPAKPSEPAPAAGPAKPEQALCRRCGKPGPVDDDGFCEGCEKALEQACL